MEHSLSSLAYKGSISAAISEAKKQRKIFIVFVSGDDAESSRLESCTWNDSKVAESISKYCIMLHLSQGSNDAIQFSAIFPQKSVPCITAVGYNGIQLWQNEGFITAEVLASSLEKLWLSLHLQDTTAAVLSAALASKTSEPSHSGASASVSVDEEGSISIRSTSTEKHDESSGAPTNVSSEKAIEEKTNAYTIEDKTCKFRDTLSSKSVEADDVECSGNETSDPFVKAVKEYQHPASVGLDSAAPDLASKAIEVSNPPEQANDSALLDLDGVSKSRSFEKKIASQDSKREPVDDTKTGVLTDAYLNIRMPNGFSLREKFSLTSALKVVKDYVDEHQESVIGSYDIAIPYPRKVFRDQDLSRTLSELGLFDRQTLIVVPHQRATDQSDSGVIVGSTNDSGDGYFSYVKRILSFINPLSYLGDASSSNNSGQQPQPGTWERGSNPMPRNNSSQAQSPSSASSQRFPAGIGSSSTARRPTETRFGSNIHTLKHDEDDERFNDNNSYWNGNSTQFGGDDNGK